MELYVLDSQWRRVEVVDKFESLIWTERFNSLGDFELVLISTAENRKLFLDGTRLAMNDSKRVMTVSTIQDDTDEEGRHMLRIKGYSIEKILDDRIARGTMSSLTTESKWALSGTPGAVLRQMFHNICVVGTLNVADVIPGVIEDSIFPDDTIGETSATVSFNLEPQTLFEAMKNIASMYDLGFRLVRDPISNILYFDVYAGADRTTGQTLLPAVVFAPGLDNIKNTSSLKTTALYKNIAYVFSPVGFQIVVPSGIDINVPGFERRILLVKADDITDTVPATAAAKMTQRGLEELAKSRGLLAFDGEITERSEYIYGIDYNVGDLVEVRDADGLTNNMRVVEQIFVSDKEGERSYPTLAINQFIYPGSWIAWDFNSEWDDMGTTDYWNTV